MSEPRDERLRDRARSTFVGLVECARGRTNDLRDLVRGAHVAHSAPKEGEPARAVPDAANAESTADPTPSRIEELVAELGASPAWQDRVHAAARLGDFHGDVVVDALLRAVRDPSAEVAVAAVSSLARQPDPRAAADLREVIRDSADYASPLTRAAAVEAIAACQGIDALSLLLDAIHDVDAEVSRAAVIAVATIAPLESASQLLSVVEDHAGYYLPMVRLAAATALEHAHLVTIDRANALLAREADEEIRAVWARIAAQ